MKGVVQRPVGRRPGTAGTDALAEEEPLEIRLAGETLAITMRTPGDDAALALGFLLAEGVLRTRDDVGAVAHCGRPGDEGYGNVIEVTPGAGARLEFERIEKTRRGTLTTSACGICGRRSIDDLLALAGVVPAGPALDPRVLASATALLKAHQPIFEHTGGVHAAAVLTSDGVVLTAAEDVGRHNAVDKVLGALLRQGRVPAVRGAGEPAILVVSGRASFEIIQKAAMARLAAVACVSAASSLAVDLAARAGLTLAAFVRDGDWALYTHPERVTAPGPALTPG
jgi:FdhD protein